MAKSARRVDQNGYLTVKDNPISKSGVFPYLGRSIGAPEPDKIYNVYRPASAWDQAALDSLKHIPLVDEHTMLGEGYMAAEEKGIHGHTGENVSFDGNFVKSDLRIYSKTLKTAMDSGKVGLSIGYRCRYTPESGTIDGVPYSYVQGAIRGNHLALCAAGRMGKDVAVLDHAIAYDDATDLNLDLKELEMAEATALDAAEVAAIVNAALDAKLAPVMARFAAMDAENDKGDADGDQDDKDDTDDAKKKAKEKVDDVADKAKKEGKGMDADEVTALVRKFTQEEYAAAIREQSQKTELAGRISAYVGTFDHSEMTLADVAKYGCEKIGLDSKGSAEAALAGYFAGKPAPSADAAFAMDSKASPSAAAAVADYFKGK